MPIAVVDRMIGSLATLVGLEPDLLRIAICLCLSYPLCAVLKRFPDTSRAFKSTYILAVSGFYLLGIMGLWAGVRTLLISTIFTWVIASKFPSSPWMPWLNFLFVLAHLFINHVDEQMRPNFNANILGITGSQMVLCMKLSAFGWNVYDGAVIKKSKDPETALSSLQRDRAVVKKPSLLDFLSYAFFFPSILTGPSFDFAEYLRWLDLSMFDHQKTNKRTIPKSHWPALVKFIQGVGWIVLWTQVTEYVNLERYSGLPFLARVVYLYLLGFSYRVKYYGAWSISEGACILSGLGYNGVDPNTGNVRWDRVCNIDPWSFETGQNTFQLLSSWNKNTNKWLKNYVYLRVTPKGRKAGFTSTMATFVTSAVWHGTRPGYYLTFIGGAFFQSLGRIFRKNIRPIFLLADGITPGPYKMYYDILSFVVTQLAFGYMVQPFILLDLRPSLQIWSSVYFYVHIGVVASIFVFQGPLGPATKSMCRRLQSGSTSPKDRARSDATRIKQMRADLVRLNSTPLLGIPEPDMDHMDDDFKEATEEIDALKRSLLEEIEKLRIRVSKDLHAASQSKTKTD